MLHINRILIAMLGLVSALGATAEIPLGYYDSCDGKTGQALLKSLYDKISDHTNVGYDGLWNVYKKSDVRADGTLWDIYSTKAWPSNFTRCGNYSVVGDCVNREHSLPKSWWGGTKSTQYSDAFHLYPTDGKVNGQRSNYPFGECANGKSLAASGNVKPLGRLGNSTFSGYSKQVFEPDDEYKGDLARSYFYMAACYNDLVSGWTSGNGGDVFAGNSYPVFTTWSQALLLKWARQDVVSQKEIDRNNAIYSFQHNRNPFIDHPELIEYIWGDKVGQAWHPGGSSEPVFEAPVQNTVINLGQAARGIAAGKNVTIKGRYLTGNVTLSATGSFSVSPATLTAAQANEGATVTVTVLSNSAGDAEGTLKLSSSGTTRTVDLYAEIVDGLPVTITNVTTEGFTVKWVNLHASAPATNYTLSVAQAGQTIAGYPVSVKASAESHTVTGLDPSTEYSVTFTDVPGNIDIPVLSVTTADLVPSIQVLFDGNLQFTAAPGEPSEVAELLLEVENIDSEITVSVDAPFEVSTDKSAWARSTTLASDEERFYLRLGAAQAGIYETTIHITAGNYVNDDAEAQGTVAVAADFLEDWEGVENPTEDVKCYSSTTFTGSACRWAVNDGGFGSGTQDNDFNGSTVLRMGSSETSSIAMADDKTAGLGTVKFDAAKWPNTREADAVVNVDYSLDGGLTWTTAQTVTLSETTSTPFTVTINKAGNGRVRFAQQSGKRWFIDNISISNFSEIGAVNELDYHTWDAFCRGGKLVIESRDSQRLISVYGMDGITWHNATVASGEVTVDLPRGLYVVTDGSFSRRVLVK
ncbi:MAG: endonuclease [Firmicutes bacterium]|nr:endonuclease [Bacillota bacterium]MCM1400393.1 endonuclease [Bacteroides sp.]MCM1477150.1 endonuclease [Bacteroides sp.]